MGVQRFTFRTKRRKGCSASTQQLHQQGARQEGMLPRPLSLPASGRKHHALAECRSQRDTQALLHRELGAHADGLVQLLLRAEFLAEDMVKDSGHRSHGQVLGDEFRAMCPMCPFDPFDWQQAMPA